VTSDQYPYTASSTSVSSALLPAWALEGGQTAQRARFKDPVTRERVLVDIMKMIRDERGGGDPKNVQFASCGFDPKLNGRTLADAIRQRGFEPTLERAAETTLWIVEQGGCQGIFHAMSEDDVVRIMQHPATMIASDGEVPAFGRGNPHPRSYGTFARVLGVYVREKHVLTLEDAVRRMTSFPAARMGLHDRGILRPGMKGRRGDFRSRARARPGDVRGAASVCGGFLVRAGQRAGGLRRFRHDGCAAWSRPLRTGKALILFPQAFHVGIPGWYHILVMGVLIPFMVVRNYRRMVGKSLALPNRMRHFRTTAIMLVLLTSLSVLIANAEWIDLYRFDSRGCRRVSRRAP
jgi:hypothetical protein